MNMSHVDTYIVYIILAGVDTEFAVHKDMRSHTGGFMTMGTGGAYVQYREKTEHQEFN